MKRVAGPTDLLSAADIADLLGVGPSAVSNWQHRSSSGKEFPEPFTHVARGSVPLWHRDDILDYARKRYGNLLQALGNP